MKEYLLSIQLAEEGTKRENEFIAHYHKFAFAVAPANAAKEGAAKTYKKKLHNATLIAFVATG